MQTALPVFPPLHAETIGEPIVCRFEKVNGTFRYSIRPASAKLRGVKDYSVVTEALYDNGSFIENLWSSHDETEEAQDELIYLAARHEGREYKRKTIYCTNNLSGWTEASALIEARKMNSPKKNDGYRWAATTDKKVPCGRHIIKGTLLMSPQSHPARQP
jgi:hypothetical protein